MTKEERASLVRIFVNLIKADSIIDEGEMSSYADIKNNYNITNEDEITAEHMTFASAISVLKKLDKQQQRKIFSDYLSLSVSDGFCARSEALLILSLYCCLQWDAPSDAEVISFPSKEIIVADNQVLYVESSYNESINEQISTHYRTLSKELNINALDLVYIPQIIEHYRETPDDLLKSVFRFLMPSLSENRINEVINKVLSVNTSVFVNDILCNKYGVKELRNIEPSLLLKIGNDIIGGVQYSNFLRISIDNSDVLHIVRDLMDYFSSLQNADTVIINLSNDSGGQFLYRGFYKQLIDLYTQKSNLNSRIVVNPYKETISLIDIDVALNGLHRKEKALYTLFLLESVNGGVDFTPPKSTSDFALYNRRMAVLQEKYAAIYELFGGDGYSAPQLDQPEIRRPMLSCIKKSVNQISSYLHSIEDYQIERDRDGIYTLHIGKDLIFCETGDKKLISLFESDVFRAYHIINKRVATL